ncbi:thermonuclease family protein [Conexibacter woesei]|uniref:thermonuclease family protein n=1 Tax=Conexibacter woesei TaxID=191495 RepID=UPI00042180F8|nr:thermonuclease family protein [Conexibacter woesei]
MFRVLALILVALAFAAVAGCGSSPSATGDTAQVRRVVDGDTILLTSGERVRLIGIDTPESVKPGTPVQCFAKRASAFTHTLLDGARVRLVYGAERRDRYGRLLAYVYRARDRLFVNAELVRQGYARTLEIAPNTGHARQFAALASAARRAGKGLWSACRR